MLPHFLAHHAVDALGHILGELRLRHKYDCEREKGHACDEQSEEEEPGDDVLDKDGAWCGWSEFSLPFAVACYLANAGGETGILLGKRE